MLVDCGASPHFIDSNPLPGIEEHVAEYETLNPSVVITTGEGLRQGVGTGNIPVMVSGQHGKRNSFLLQAAFPPGSTYF